MPHTASSSRSFRHDVESIRSQFPALERRYQGHQVAYFDGPGGTQVPRGVVDAMADYLFQHNANTHWNYPTSAETDAAIAEARQARLRRTAGGAAPSSAQTSPLHMAQLRVARLA